MPVVVLLFASLSPAQTSSEKADTTRSQKPDLLHMFNDATESLSRRVSGSVVQVFTTGFSLADRDSRNTASVLSPERGTGAGIVLTTDGYIMTNGHVVQNARKIRVMLNSRERERNVEAGHAMRGPLEGKLIGIDRLTDLALIKVEARDLPALTLADSSDLKQGQLVFAFGSPLGLDNSVSMGVVSAVARQIDPNSPMIYIQTDAPINPGNSGGPLVDIDGNVVGMNTFILSQSGGSEGIGFAIPSNVIRNIYQQLKQDGHVHRGQIGVFARTITPSLAQGLSLPRDEGVILEDVIPGGPADQSGLKVGDIILNLAGHPVHDLREFALALFRFTIGQPVPVVALRGNQEITSLVPVIERADDPQRFADLVNERQNMISKLGILGLTLTDQVRALLPDLRVPTGVIVAARTAGNDFFGDELQQGDVIHFVNGKPVADVASLRSAVESIPADKPLVLQVERQGTLNFLVLEAD
ncbi:MAG TPA: trypsin-like peptidase domain-containing protein [Terriglobales bacterium]|nr:trypsin-like peptidase domain-containing protein [Terriglobales bacterium]